MAEGIVTLPDGRRARITAPDRETLERKAREVAGRGFPGEEPREGKAAAPQPAPQPAAPQPAEPRTARAEAMPEPPQEEVTPGMAFGRAALGRFVNNILGLPDLVVTGLANIETPTSMLESQTLRDLRAARTGQSAEPRTITEAFTGRRPPPIGSDVVPLPTAGDIAATGRFAGNLPGNVAAGNLNLGQQFQQAQEAQQAESARVAEEAPVATRLGGVAGDVASLLSGRAPAVRGLARATPRGVARTAAARVGTSPSRAPGLQRAMERAFTSRPVKGLANSAGKSLEAGFEGAVLSILQDGDPAETAAFAAGGQAAGNLALGLTTTRRGLIGLATAAAAGTAAIQLTKSVVPGGQDFILQSVEESFDNIKWGILAGLGAGLAGAGRLRGRQIAEDFPAVADAVTAIPRGAVISLIEDFTSDNEGRIEPVLNELAADPESFSPTARRRLERAIKSESVSVSQTIDSLMEKDRQFRERFSNSSQTAPSGSR